MCEGTREDPSLVEVLKGPSVLFIACTGSWLGAGTNCSSDPCAPTGACCTGSSCSITTASDCNGNYLGDGTSCAADPCAPPDPTGACCTGSSCSVTTEASCSGTYLGDGSDCGTDPCAPTGACCVGTSCSVVKESECSGAWQGANTDCASDPCAAPTGSTLLMAFRGNPTINGRRYKDEDIMSYDPTNGETSVYFDGSDVGFASGRIHAFCLLPDGDILISPHKAMTIPGLSGGPSGESVDDSDIIRFSPTNLGGATSGSWSFYFDGSDVGLTTNGEDIDGLSVLSDGALLISTVGSPGVTGLSSLKDEDIVRFDASALGASTGGSWSYYMDGSDVGLSADKYHDVDALTVLTEGIISLSTLGNYNVGSIAGGDEDVIDFAVTSFGSSTSGSFSLLFDGSADLSLPSNADILGLHEVGAP
ncbi:MAG: hypothetical protein P8J86_06945 [Phycisphaerales bacterium]|nr:hypothetical protein [Phycisphaerales bacterium]